MEPPTKKTKVDDKLSFGYVYKGGQVKDKKITKVIIQKGLEKIDAYAFECCTKLESVIFSEGLKEIGNDAFSGCSSLRNIELPDSLMIIGYFAFFICEGLESVKIPQGVTEIKIQVFGYCTSLTKVIIPKGVVKICVKAFHNCSSLCTIELPESLTIIEHNAFQDCKSLTELIIPESVVEIGNRAFFGCAKVESVDLPRELTNNIGEDAFRGCFSSLHDQFEKNVSMVLGVTDCLRILEKKPLSIRTKNMKGSLPLHIAVEHARPDIVDELLQVYEEGVMVFNDDGDLPLHSGLKALVSLSEESVDGEALEAISVVLNSWPDATMEINSDGCTPLFLMCRAFQSNYDEPGAYLTLLKDIFDEYPEAATISCSGAFPINVFVEQCPRLDDGPDGHGYIRRVFRNGAGASVKQLLSKFPDGRSLRPLCSLKDRVSLLVFLLIFDERDKKELQDLDAGAAYKPRLNLNNQVLFGWSLLEIIADFDTVDSADILLRIIKKQRDKLNQKESTLSIKYQPQDRAEMNVEFCSVKAIKESVLVRVADRAKLCKSSPKLREWGQTYGRLLGRYRVEANPKHVSKTSVVVFGTEAVKDYNGHLVESPVALKFMYDKGAFAREVEKRKGTSPDFVLPIRAFFVPEKENDIELQCDHISGESKNFGSDLKRELFGFPEIAKECRIHDHTKIYLLVMERGGGFDLDFFIRNQSVAGENLFAVISIAKEIALCLQDLNEKRKIIHGDVKARNFVSRGVGQFKFAAIDLDNAASIEHKELAGQKRTSSGYLPPEQAAVELQLREQPDTVAPGGVIASAQYDMWCFGVLLYFLCSGTELFRVDNRQELVKPNDLEDLKKWDATLRESKLVEIKSGWPLDLLDWLLKQDPVERPKNWQEIIGYLDGLGGTVKEISYKTDRLVVFQSDPLINGHGKAMPRLNFKSEVRRLEEDLGDASAIFSNIEIVVEAATSHALHVFLNQKLSRVLHLSGHGEKDCFALENGEGSVDPLQCDALKQMVEKEGGFLELVVVIACYSQNIGQAFIDAGVPHVVCINLEHTVFDLSARVFSSSFYRALACGRTLQKAFEIAKDRVRVDLEIKRTPQIKDPGQEAEKFLLLPKDRKDPDVLIFFTQEVKDWKPKDPPQMNTPPPLPAHFLGREGKMCDVIGACRASDLVNVHGSGNGDSGVGKTCLVAAACRYMLEIPRCVPIGFFYWLDPFTRINHGEGDEVAIKLYEAYYDGVCNENGHYNSSMLQPLKDLLAKASKEDDTDNSHVFLLVIDERKEGKFQAYQGNLKTFLNDMLSINNDLSRNRLVVKIILISSSEYVYDKDGVEVSSILVQPLYFPDALKLLRVRLPDRLKEFFPESKVSELKETLHPHVEEHADAIWGRYLGCGIPGKIIKKAANMKEGDVMFLMNYKYPALRFKRTVELLWENLDPLMKQTLPHCGTSEELYEHLEPKPDKVRTNEYKELFKRLGNGIPHEVVKAAKGMNEDEMKEIDLCWPLQFRQNQPSLFL